MRIRVTGYINIDDLEPEELDLDHTSGLTEDAHEKQIERHMHLEDVQLDLVAA